MNTRSKRALVDVQEDLQPVMKRSRATKKGRSPKAPGSSGEGQQASENVGYEAGSSLKGCVGGSCPHMLALLPNGACDEERTTVALDALRRDARLGKVMSELDCRPQFRRRCAFDWLVKSIIGQQISGKATGSILARLMDLLSLDHDVVLRPCYFKGWSPDLLRPAGVSNRKAQYILGCADAFHAGSLDQTRLEVMTDEQVISTLTALKGVGEWSAHMLMMFSLRRDDVLPHGDLGVRKGAAKLIGKSGLPSRNELEEIFEPFRPYRSYASYFMWRLAGTVLVKNGDS